MPQWLRNTRDDILGEILLSLFEFLQGQHFGFSSFLKVSGDTLTSTSMNRKVTSGTRSKFKSCSKS
uniref:Uncharacterized protein n=1 Tax=Helianthus annuus TaxID=4232 RepID=A0A251UVH8_HELAN